MALPLRAGSAPAAVWSGNGRYRRAAALIVVPNSGLPARLPLQPPKAKPRPTLLPLASAPTGSPGTKPAVAPEDFTRSLERVEVFDLTGKAIPVVELWRDRKSVVAFARHFGCVLCRKRADLLASKKEQMDAAGVGLVLIGPGSVDQAKAFSEQTKFPGEVYADPGHSSFNALNFVSGILTTFTPSAGLKIVQSYMEGYRQDWGLSFQKDTMSRGGWQQGGILIAGPGISNITYFHKDKEAGDDPNIEDIVKACCM